MKLYGIWCKDEKDWLRELPSKVDDGGEAILAFQFLSEAKARAAQHYACDTYAEAKRQWCEVLPLTS